MTQRSFPVSRMLFACTYKAQPRSFGLNSVVFVSQRNTALPPSLGACESYSRAANHKASECCGAIPLSSVTALRQVGQQVPDLSRRPFFGTLLDYRPFHWLYLTVPGCRFFAGWIFAERRERSRLHPEEKPAITVASGRDNDQGSAGAGRRHVTANRD